MKNSNLRKFPVGLLFGLLLGVGVSLLGFDAVRNVLAQTTSAFTEPNCNPNDPDGPQCNTSAPIFVKPTDLITSQVIQSPLQIGVAGATKKLTLQGDAEINSGTFKTGTSFAGQAINVSSTGDYSIVAASAANHAIFATGSNGYAGVYAVSPTGNAIIAEGATAARLKGNVIIETYGGAATASLTVPGTINVTGTNSQILINGQEVQAASGLTKSLVASATGAGVTTVNVKSGALSNNNYKVTSIRVSYADATTNDRWWKWLADANLVYKECTNRQFVGSLELTNPGTTAVDYRVDVSYEKTIQACPGQDDTAPTVALTAPIANRWYTGNVTITATASDNIGVTEVRFYTNQSATPICTDTTAPYSCVWNTALYTDTYGGGLPHDLTAVAYDAAGNNTTSAVVRTNTTNGDNVTICNGTPNSTLCVPGVTTCCQQTSYTIGTKSYSITPAACISVTATCGTIINNNGVVDGPGTAGAL